MSHYETQRDIMRHHKTPRDIMRHNWTFWDTRDITRHHEAIWDIMRHNEALWDIRIEYSLYFCFIFLLALSFLSVNFHLSSLLASVHSSFNLQPTTNSLSHYFHRLSCIYRGHWVLCITAAEEGLWCCKEVHNYYVYLLNKNLSNLDETSWNIVWWDIVRHH